MYKVVISSAGGVAIAVATFVHSGKAAPQASSSSGAQNGTFVGRITDLKCKSAVNADCNRQCLNSGEQAVLLLDNTGEILLLKDADSAKKYPGAHVEVSGTRKNNTIRVNSVTAK